MEDKNEEKYPLWVYITGLICLSLGIIGGLYIANMIQV
jgi:hypothetical protein